MAVPPHFEAASSPELQRIVARVLAGEEVVIDESGTPVAKVIAFPSRPRAR